MLYVTDFSYWVGKPGRIARGVGVALCIFLACASALLTMASQPVLPMCLFLMLLPLTALFLRKSLFRANSSVDVSYILAFNFLVASLAILLLWVLWLFGSWHATNNHWFENRALFSSYAQCNATAETGAWAAEAYHVTDEHGTAAICLAAFMLWMSPLIVAGFCFALSVFLFLVAQYAHARPPTCLVPTRLRTRPLDCTPPLCTLPSPSAGEPSG